MDMIKNTVTNNNYVVQVCRTCNATGMDCGVQNASVGPGIEDADFVFYVSAMETERCHKGLTVAYAAHCQQEAVLDRYETRPLGVCGNCFHIGFVCL